MGKQDKLYLTPAEWTSEFGGLKHKKRAQEYKKLPFHCCSLTFTPFENPVCTLDGTIFDLEHIVPWLKQHSTNPVTGLKLDLQDLVKLNISKSAAGAYQCPITFKPFTNNTHIVAIKTTGNVYSMEAIEELNFKPKYFKDLLSDVKFTRKDIICLQDPMDLKGRNMIEFDFVKKGIKVADSKIAITKEASVNSNGTVGAVLKEIEERKDAEQKDVKQVETKKHNQAHFSTGLSAYSTTSTSFTPSTKTVAATISNDDYLIDNVKDKSKVLLETNFGDLEFDLYCKEAPRASYNFVMLLKQGIFC